MWEDVKRNLVEWYGATSEKTIEVAKVTSRRYDKFGISRDIERQFSELGNLVYLGLREGREGVLKDPAIAALMRRLEQLEMELQAKEEEINTIRNEHRQRQSPEGAATVETPEDAVNGQDFGGADQEIIVAPLDVADSDHDSEVPEQQDGKNPG